MPPEQKARVNIDRQLEQAGWLVQDASAANIRAALGIALREFPLKKGFADYLLYVDGKAIGLIEAKPEGFPLKGVETQSLKYVGGLPKGLPNYCLPLPFSYESTGAVTQFTNHLDPQPRSREVFTFHRPEELLRLVKLDGQLREKVQQMPEIDSNKLWKVQTEAIANLEKSLAENRPRALIQMATGSGKTYTACNICYRLIKFAGAKRILFLVDRNNLGRQTVNEFQQFDSPYSQYKFTEEYNVQHLRKNNIDPASKVVITTIQRLYSILKGEPDYDEGNEEESSFESDDSPLISEPLPVVYNPQIPIETFDYIAIDECHRSIYNVWRQVLEYFDASLIGLTATPTPQTIGFFYNNLVQNYSHEKAVADGVNVGYEVYRIKTKVTESGATLEAEPERFIPLRDRRTQKRRLVELAEDLTYTANQLDRDVMNPSQIRLVIRTFKERLYTEIFPHRREVPKTLIFAKTDLHADDIVKIVREEFGKGNDFCQKITCKTTGRKPEDLINDFRNSPNPRIAVTVDMIATGTDVKALECLMFLRNIKSASYFEQMKGRGCRIISSDELQQVSGKAKHKTHFVIVDAVGVCEQDKTNSKPLDRQPYVPLEKVLKAVSLGMVHPDVVSTLAARLARLQNQFSDSQLEEIAAIAGQSLPSLTANLFESIDPDVTDRLARERFNILPDGEPTEAQLDAVEGDRMTEALSPFLDPQLREAILSAKTLIEQVIDEVTQDELISAGFDAGAKDKAQAILQDFRAFLDDHRDQIEAIQILYSRPYRAGLRYRQVKELAAALQRPPLMLSAPQQQLWKLFEAVEPERVRGKGGKALVDLIAIVRHALHPDEPLVPVAEVIEARYQEWLSEKAPFLPDQQAWLDAIKNHIATSLSIEQDDFVETPFAQMGGLGRVYDLFGDRLPSLLEELNDRLAA